MSVWHDPDLNAWAGRDDLCDPTCARSPVQVRDPLDGGALGPFLDRLAVRRGRAAVRADVIAWLAAPDRARVPDEGWAGQ